MGAAAQRRGAASRPQPSPGRDQGAPKAHGPVAQLVEQRVYTAAVVGSSPAGSTTGLLDGPLSCAVRVSASGSRAALRARGGRPALLTRLAEFAVCSPRARGVTATPARGRVRPRLFPAREG